MAIYSDREAARYPLCNVSWGLLFLLPVRPFPLLCPAVVVVLPRALVAVAVPSTIDLCCFEGRELMGEESADEESWNEVAVFDLCGGRDEESALCEGDAQQGSRLSFCVVGPESYQIFLLEIFGGCSRDDIARESVKLTKFVRSQKITKLKPRPNL
jgi:hypothetical protein